MKTWRISDARANMADVFRLARSRGPQRIVKRGEGAVIVVAEEAWKAEAMTPERRAAWAKWLTSMPVDIEAELPERRPARVFREGIDL